MTYTWLTHSHKIINTIIYNLKYYLSEKLSLANKNYVILKKNNSLLNERYNRDAQYILLALYLSYLKDNKTVS